MINEIVLCAEQKNSKSHTNFEVSIPFNVHRCRQSMIHGRRRKWIRNDIVTLDRQRILCQFTSSIKWNHFIFPSTTKCVYGIRLKWNNKYWSIHFRLRATQTHSPKTNIGPSQWLDRKRTMRALPFKREYSSTVYDWPSPAICAHLKMACYSCLYQFLVHQKVSCCHLSTHFPHHITESVYICILCIL